ncbi:SdpI family protein [Hymenobacter busanensis]|uniref:SdpI family protein n=1 Tax=Hymenobacter busanensis TaxID=2607656 RepID=A0A7L4ZW81_9BACT|nr:SdpI family protein [Hymenobacter busanensis]KAA9332194.1 SdpI family protein [Hymenobacter busanensis]QHJ07468.1 hypothetical protein GUY19_09295 [Hymenobacter busanensis]
MDKESIAPLIALAGICGLSLVIAWVTRYHPPRQINLLYGYRTTRSMRTPATWQEANTYFAHYFWRLSWTLPVLAATAYLLLGDARALVVLLAGWVLGLLIGVVRTERRLKRLFDDNGQPRN